MGDVAIVFIIILVAIANNKEIIKWRTGIIKEYNNQSICNTTSQQDYQHVKTANQ